MAEELPPEVERILREQIQPEVFKGAFEGILPLTTGAQNCIFLVHLRPPLHTATG